MTKRKIYWEYWRSPYGDDENEFVSEDEADVKSPWEEREEEEYEGKRKPVKIRPVISTPMGFMPISPYQSFSEAFQFWMGHTNFDITQEVKDKIEATPGVEILDIITRYCFRIAIGKVFDGKEVKAAIQHNLDADPPKKGEINPHDMKLDKETQDKLGLIQSTLMEKFPFWAIYIMPNAEIDVAGSNTQEGYDMHLDLYKKAQEYVGGVIYQYA